MATHSLSVFGLGKLGSPLVAALAHGGMRVVGVDIVSRPVELLNEGAAPVVETGLQEAITAARERISATMDAGRAVRETSVSFIVAPTPSLPDGSFSNEHVEGALKTIGAALRDKASRHTVVICSTVVPGSVGGVLRDALEGAAGRKLGPLLGLCYSPMFIALGSVLQNMRRPDLVLIGESAPEAGAELEAVFRTFQTNAHYCHMSFVNAEIAKLAVNTFVTTKISYANMLADLCEHMPGADVDVVTDAIGRDSRIGSRYLRGAVAYGGPCFPRDNAALASVARAAGADPALAVATDQVNRHQTGRLARIIEAHHVPGTSVAILGLAYKQDTDVIDESPGMALARALIVKGVDVRLHDPLANANVRRALPEAHVVDDVEDALRGASMVVVATAAAAYRVLPWSDSNRTLIDCWRVVDPSRVPPAVSVVRLGAGAERS